MFVKLKVFIGSQMPFMGVHEAQLNFNKLVAWKYQPLFLKPASILDLY
jgi:hypothetical protein